MLATSRFSRMTLQVHFDLAESAISLYHSWMCSISNPLKWASFLMAVMLSLSGSSAWAGSGSEGASFLDIPVGSIPASLGSAYTARATDAYAPVWNPAGLGFVNAVEVSATHLSYIQALNYEYLGSVIPLGDSAHQGLGASVQYLGSGNITSRDENGAITGAFSTTFAAYSLAYGQALTDQWTVGLTGKAITEAISDASAAAFAGDVGTLYKITDEITLGAVAANLGPSIKFVSESDSLPAVFRTGIYDQFAPDWDTSADVVYRRTGLLSVDAGLQWSYGGILALRVGADSSHVNGLSAVSALSAGVGIHVFGQEFNYAWLPYSDLGNAQYFSLDLRFGGPSEAQKPHMREAKKEQASTDSEYKNLNDMLSDDEKKALPKSSDPKEQE